MMNCSFEVNTLAALVWYKFYKSEKQTDANFTTVPMSIYLFGVLLTFMSLWPYISNLALREFTIKLLKNGVQSLLWWWPSQNKQKTSKTNTKMRIKVNSVNCVSNFESNPSM